MTSHRNEIPVEVVYGHRDRQELIELHVPRGTTVIEAVKASGIMDLFPEIDLAHAKLGVFGRLENADRIVEPRDRIEIYRPLHMDPREARRRRANGW